MPANVSAGRRDSAGAQQTQVVYIPPQTTPGLGPPRAWNGAWIQLFPTECRMMNDG